MTKTNRNIERHYFEQFRAVYALPRGTVAYKDKPDVILEGERKVGIEITNFYLKSGNQPESEQRQRQLRDEVVCEAHALHRRAGGGGIELTIGFDACTFITQKRKRELPAELVALASCGHKRISGKLERSMFETLPEISFVYMNAAEFHDARWRVIGTYSVEFMSAETLEGIVREKESKAVHYEQCDAYWLLIVVDAFDSAQEQEIGIGGLRVASNVFEKILGCVDGFNQHQPARKTDDG